MLKSLKIKNVALISQAEIEFGDNLNVMSGETGAGKSVVLECLNFALGQKADKTMITSGETSCSVVCVFDISSDEGVKAELDRLEIEYDDELIVRRTLTSDGKSSVKINGETVNATMLKKVTSKLVDVHGQSDHFVLLKESNQLELLDKLGGAETEDLKGQIRAVLDEIDLVDAKLKNLGGSAADRERRADYLSYCIKEIEDVDFKKGEDEELTSKKVRLINSEKIVSAVSEASEMISGDNSALDLVTQAERCVTRIAKFDSEFDLINEKLSAIIDELGDVEKELTSLLDTDFDPGELDLIEQRLDKINRIKSKYGGDHDAVYEKYDAFREELSLLRDSDANAARFEAEKAKLISSLNGLYDKLTLLRKSIAKDLSFKLKDKLKELSMKNADFDVLFERNEGVLSADGADRVTFLFSANLGEPLKQLSKVISGGELSRLMLAIKSVTGNAFDGATYVFDEIDAGISGNAAKVVAENFARIAVDKQIIAISHLPQIVAMADRSLLIEKVEADGKTRSTVTELDGDSKIREVLRLIGGTESKSGFEHAAEMIRLADQYKRSI